MTQHPFNQARLKSWLVFLFLTGSQVALANEPAIPVSITYSAEVHVNKCCAWFLDKKWLHGFESQDAALGAIADSLPEYSLTLYHTETRAEEGWWFYSHAMEPTGYPAPTHHGWSGNSNIPPLTCSGKNASINEYALVVHGPPEDREKVGFYDYVNNCITERVVTAQWGWRVHTIKEVKSCPEGLEISADKTECNCIYNDTGHFDLDAESQTLEYDNSPHPLCNQTFQEQAGSDDEQMCEL